MASINVDSSGLQQYFLNEVQKAQNLELLKPIAVDIANKQVVTLPKFQYWKENNIQFETYTTASYDDTDPAYKPELLTVRFAVPKLNSYINIFVDTNKKPYLKLREVMIEIKSRNKIMEWGMTRLRNSLKTSICCKKGRNKN